MQSVYGLVDPRDKQVRYVGKAKDVHSRYGQHLVFPHKNIAKDAWLAELKAAGILPELLIIESNIEDSSSWNREKHWIEYYLAQGSQLTNVMHGNTANRKPAKKEHEQPLLKGKRNIEDWINAKKAAQILTEQNGRKVTEQYVRTKGDEGKLTTWQIDARTKLYSRKEIEAYQVKPRGDGSVRRAVRKDAREKADSSDA